MTINNQSPAEQSGPVSDQLSNNKNPVFAGGLTGTDVKNIALAARNAVNEQEASSALISPAPVAAPEAATKAATEAEAVVPAQPAVHAANNTNNIVDAPTDTNPTLHAENQTQPNDVQANIGGRRRTKHKKGKSSKKVAKRRKSRKSKSGSKKSRRSSSKKSRRHGRK